MSKFKNVKVLTTSAMLVALSILLGFFKIPVNQFVEIRFGTLPTAMAAMLFGPVAAGLVSALADVGSYFVKPTGPFFPGFTVSAAVTGIIFGLVLYKKKVSFWRILLAEALHCVIVGMLLNTFWLTQLYGTSFLAIFPARAIRELIMLPVNAAILTLVMKPVSMTSFFQKVRVAQ